MSDLNGLRVVILSPTPEYLRMFTEYGAGVITAVNSRYQVVNRGQMDSCDLLVFTGGADVDPSLYGAIKHSLTHSDMQRDVIERDWFKAAKERGIPMVGICRGGQFLNVMSGGKMAQHVVGHATGNDHLVYVPHLDKEVMCSSTHHQMMLPDTAAANVLGYAEILLEDGIPDTEIVYYPHTRSLCFQPHPEFFKKGHECPELFMDLVSEYLLD